MKPEEQRAVADLNRYFTEREKQIFRDLFKTFGGTLQTEHGKITRRAQK